MRSSSRVIWILNLLLAPAFGLSVAVQYNDPDPLRWMLIYGAAAAACVLFLLRRLHPLVPAVIAGAAAIWAATIIPGFFGRTSPARMFEHWHMENAVVEQEREFFGLFIVAVWMGVLAAVTRTAPRARR